MIIPRSTYRLQLHKDFGFAAASAALPYLAELGVSHVYCSPIWQARAGSTHGYDVVDHSRINDELGGESAFRAFAAEARSRGMGLLLDIVPNHMGVFGRDNPWWLDVLENGQASEFADYFDIDWHPPNRSLEGKLLVPVLGDHYGNVLGGGGLQLGFDAVLGRLALVYEEHLFPIDPSTYSAVLERVEGLPQALLDGFAGLPSRDAADPAARADRRERQRSLQAALAETALAAPVAAAIARAVAWFNDEPGRQSLSALHDRQAYRLSSWRVASADINYRRFFDVNSLAALRIEDERVFEATQSLALSLAAEGVADGLRIDHSDGLHDPAQYFERLQQGYARRVAERSGAAPSALAGDRSLFVLAEKIVGVGEDVPLDWALSGTTGYDFAALVNGLFVERRNAERLAVVWSDFTDNFAPYAETVRVSKQWVARKSLGAELTVLANALQHIALTDQPARDYTLDDLREALSDVAACMPVYRTYVSRSVSGQDARFIDQAVAQARRHTDVRDLGMFDMIRAVLSTGAPQTEPVPEIDRLKNRFAMRFQQFTSPVAAKGVEDTAFYRYHRLVSLNEVGGTPAVFGVSAQEFHAANAARRLSWPHTMLGSSTHDTKRSEDVRHRIDVLSEQPAALRLGLRRFRLAAELKRDHAAAERSVSSEDLYLLYQTLLGTLPAAGFGPGELAPYRERIGAYMKKAARESKRDTSWNRPDEAYEQALQALVDRVLDDGASEGPSAAAALPELLQRSAALAWPGAFNGLSATVLKLTVPGVPDTYQGNDLIDLSLVDPDNRRPIDYVARQALLAEFGSGSVDPRSLLAAAPDGRIKLWCLWRLLAARNAHPGLFADGDYTPVRVRGSRRASAIAFTRRGDDASLIVVAGRKFGEMNLARGELPIGVLWEDTHLRTPRGFAPGAEAVDLLTGATVSLEPDAMALSDLLQALPVAAVLVAAPRR